MQIINIVKQVLVTLLNQLRQRPNGDFTLRVPKIFYFSMRNFKKYFWLFPTRIWIFSFTYLLNLIKHFLFCKIFIYLFLFFFRGPFLHLTQLFLLLMKFFTCNRPINFRISKRDVVKRSRLINRNNCFLVAIILFFVSFNAN